MPPSSAVPPRRFVERFTDLGPPMLMLALVAALWFLMVERARHDDRLVIQEAIVNHGNIALAASLQAEQALGRVRFYGRMLNAQAGAGGLVRKASVADAALLRLMHFGADGRFLFSTGTEPEPWLRTLAREFASATEGTDDERLLVGRVPASEHAQLWSLPVIHRPAGARSVGFMIALLDLGYFLRQYEGYALGRHGEIVLADEDGRELLRVKSQRLDPVDSILGSQRHRLAFSIPSGSVVEDTRDGHQRIYAFQRVVDSPLAVLVSRTRYDILLENTSTQRGYWLSALLLTLLALVPMIAWSLAARRRRELMAKLARVNEENAALVKQFEAEKLATYHLATHDKLTGLANRMLFAEIAGRYRARALRTRSRFAVMFIDLDRFKPINDTHGHKAGDQLLIGVAGRLLDCVRQADLVARIGGDEFIALLADLHSVQDVENTAAKMVGRLSQPFADIVAEPVQVSPSIGIAIFPDDASEIDDLVRYADAAMYRAKERGRATYVFADPAMNRKHDLRVQIEAALPGALGRREIALHYQPKVSLLDFRLTGLEALARWRHATLGEVSPGEFIPVAEESGLIVELGEQVIDAVCAQMADWRRAGIAPVPVAINVSPLQLRSPRLAERIAMALERHILPAPLLMLEITESVVIEADNQVLAMLRQLDAMGLTIAIDDFGTGFSGLNHLRTLPVSYLKIDRSFVRDIRNDVNDATIVSSTIALSHNLRLRTIAEGVETVEQLAHLRAAGCDEAQGFLLAPPLAPVDLEPLLSDPHRFRNLIPL